MHAAQLAELNAGQVMAMAELEAAIEERAALSKNLLFEDANAAIGNVVHQVRVWWPHPSGEVYQCFCRGCKFDRTERPTIHGVK